MKTQRGRNKMPKMKTNSGAKKRFKLTSGGTQIKRACQNKNHILNKKTRERKRRLRQGDYVGSEQEKAIRTLIGAGGKPRSKKPEISKAETGLQSKPSKASMTSKAKNDGGAK